MVIRLSQAKLIKTFWPAPSTYQISGSLFDLRHAGSGIERWRLDRTWEVRKNPQKTLTSWNPTYHTQMGEFKWRELGIPLFASKGSNHQQQTALRMLKLMDTESYQDYMKRVHGKKPGWRHRGFFVCKRLSLQLSFFLFSRMLLPALRFYVSYWSWSQLLGLSDIFASAQLKMNFRFGGFLANSSRTCEVFDEQHS